jgi:sugar O-acyltransferase (sialic acid O-acetyltransferase NeuD family)
MVEPATDLYLFGAGSHSRVVLSVLGTIPILNTLTIVIRDDENIELGSQNWPKADFITQSEFERASFRKSSSSFHVAIGDNVARFHIASLALEKGLKPLSVISPTAVVSPFASLGVGIFAGPNSHVGPGAQVGNFSIINTLANLEHDSSIGDFSHLAPGSCVCGNSIVGEGSFIGANAVVREGGRLGKWSTLGALSYLNSRNFPDHSILVGSPAKSVGLI